LAGGAAWLVVACAKAGDVARMEAKANSDPVAANGTFLMMSSQYPAGI